MVRICLVAGAGPNFMKIAPVARALESLGVSPAIVHTGQHYDERMSEGFFRELAIPPPLANLQPARFGAAPEIWDGKAAQRIAESLCAA